MTQRQEDLQYQAELRAEVARLRKELEEARINCRPPGCPEGMRVSRILHEAIGDQYGFYGAQYIAELEPIPSAPEDNTQPVSAEVEEFSDRERLDFRYSPGALRVWRENADAAMRAAGVKPGGKA